MWSLHYVDDDTAEEIEKVIRLVDAKVNGKLPVMEHIHKGDVRPLLHRAEGDAQQAGAY